jgi:hypothetical protein
MWTTGKGAEGKKNVLLFTIITAFLHMIGTSAMESI